jgi:flagellin
MESVSARSAALQTQQQLAIQSLSTANNSPQTLLSLFN